VTVRQLLNHTSGIPSYTGLGPAWARRWGEEMSPDTLVALTASQPMWFAPGSSWRYDNSGYVVLGMLIEKVAGRPWGVDMEERFIKPLGLSETLNCLTRPVVPRRVHGYEPEGAGWANATYLAMTQPYAAGALCSSVRDLARWNRALHTGQVVSPASYALMTTPDGAAARARYGFGLGRDMWVPSADVSITVLTNSSSAPAGRLLRQAARAVLGVPLQVLPTVVPLTAADRARYVGVYALALPGGARDFTVAEQGDGLTGQLAGDDPIPLLHYGNHTFGASFDPALRIIFTVERGRSTMMTLVQGGGRFDGPRK